MARMTRPLAAFLLAVAVTGNAHAQLVANGSFETLEGTSSGFPTVFGDWSDNNVTSIVTAEMGITPPDGTHMLRFDQTNLAGPFGGSTGARQFIDLSSFGAEIDAGLVMVSASASFNRVAGDAQTDTQFILQLRAYDGTIASNTVIGNMNVLLSSDGLESTWETVDVVLELPVGTDFIHVLVCAHEDVVNDSTNPEFDGHYVDDVQVTLNRSPLASAGLDQTVECSSPDGTDVTIDGSASSDPDGDPLEFEWSVAEGSGAAIDDPFAPIATGTFPVGPTLVTLTVTDGNGGVDVADVLITVVDTTSPVLVCTTDIAALWPPNHEMVPVLLSVVVSDACENPEDLLVSCNAGSNEPDDGTGDGEFVGDVDGADGFTAPVPIDLAYNHDTDTFEAVVLLRAERDGAASSRVYSIVCDVLDTAGNVATSSCVVVVPHDRRKK